MQNKDKLTRKNVNKRSEDKTQIYTDNIMLNLVKLILNIIVVMYS